MDLMDGACRPQLHSHNQIINLKAMDNPKGTYNRSRKSETMSPNPTDERYAPGHDPKAVDGDGVPVACSATAANVNDTIVFERLFLTAFAVMARIRAVFVDKSYDAERHRNLCRQFGAEPHIHKRGQPHGSGLSKRRWPVERSNAWLL
jgi:transposase